MKRWSYDEIILLQQEAESRARAGHSRTDISRALNVPLYTLNRWAFEGSWREKDILAEQARARAEAMRQRLADRRAREASLAPRFGAVSRTALLEPALETKSMPDPGTPSPAPDEQQHSDGPAAFDRLREIWAEENDNPPWSARAPVVKTPPWAPGGNIEDPDACALFLASDLMRQGLLVDAERALRFARNWDAAFEHFTRKWDKEEAERARWQEKRDIEADLEARTAGRAEAAAVAAGGGGGA